MKGLIEARDIWLIHGIISSPLMTQGGQPCKQQNSAQGGPPCASYLLCRAVRPPTSKTMHRADHPVHQISYTGRSALQPAEQCAGRTAPRASYKLHKAVRPPTSKTMRRADRPVHHISYTGRSALQPAKQCAGRTALCIISTPALQGHRVLGATNLHIYPLLHCGIKKLCLG